MKKLFVICTMILSFTVTQYSFAACEAERDARDRAKSVAKTWSDISGGVAIAGMIIGGILLGPAGGLCGSAGAVPGVGAFIATKKLEEKEENLKRCEEDHANYLNVKAEKERMRVIEAQAQASSKVIGRIFRRTMEDCERRLEAELDELLESYILSDRDLEDPQVRQEMKDAADALQKKYF